MDTEDHGDRAAASVAAAIGEPARARMLYCLMDGQARTSTELSVVADIAPSTASVHLARLAAASLVTVRVQGKHRYYSLAGGEVAHLLERLSVLAGGVGGKPLPSAPNRLKAARTCYDHLAGEFGVLLHDRFHAMGFLLGGLEGDDGPYELTPAGVEALRAFDVDGVRKLRRRFAYGCIDWSEGRPHLGGALGAAVLDQALRRGWVVRDLDSRALDVTPLGRRELATRFGLKA